MVDVLNRGISGQEAPEELERMQGHIIDERPSLVVWQVGTNAVWQRGRDLNRVAASILKGLERLGKEDIDVVVMDLQYAPALLTDDKIDATRQILSIIGEIAASKSVNVFTRFELMRKFLEFERVAFDRIIDPNDHRSSPSKRLVCAAHRLRTWRGYSDGWCLARLRGFAPENADFEIF
jgi:hypothetical protein